MGRKLIAYFKNVKHAAEKENGMDEGGETVYYNPQDHPWLEMPVEDSVDEEILYSLDEIRVW